jgi:hypothetical protein
MVRSRLNHAVKLAFALGIITWMVRSGRLDFSQLSHAAESWRELAGIAGLCYGGNMLMAWRWRLLLDAQRIHVSAWHVFSYSMIGWLFSTVIPGAVSGDVMKAYYIGRLVPDKKAPAVTAILVDRIIGLIGLLTLGACAGVGCRSLIFHSPSVSILWSTVAGLASAGWATLLLFLFCGTSAAGRLRGFVSRIPGSGLWLKGVDLLLAFRERPSVVVAALTLTLVAQTLACVMFWLAARALGAPETPFLLLMFVVPLGLATMALPIAPAGLGVGQMAFYTLFEILRPGAGKLGAAIATLYQAVFVAVSLSGVVFYIFESPRRDTGRQQHPGAP